MKKRPFLLALFLSVGIFIFFLTLILLFTGSITTSSSLALGEKVGVIEVTGTISSSKKIIEQLEEFCEDSSVKAIVLRIDSPGGGVGPSQEIYREVSKAVDIKPLVVSMGGVAASGGYYISAPSSRIFANPGTITGSIGVIMEFTNVENLLEKIGLKSQVVKSGINKDIGSPVRPMTEEDRKLLQSLIDDVHEQFIMDVSQGRGLSVEAVRAVADGRIYTGRQALDRGLVDELGNLQDAISSAAALAGISGEPKVVYPPKEKRKLIDYLVESFSDHLVRSLREGTGTGLQYIWQGF